MVLVLKDLQKESSENQGYITDSTPLSGDLGGVLPSPSVNRINGRTVPNGGTSGQSLVVSTNGSAYQFANKLNSGATFGGDVSGQFGNISVVGLRSRSFPVGGTAGQALEIIDANSMNWATFVKPTTAFTGDVSGTQGSSFTVTGIQGKDVEVGGTEGQVLAIEGNSFTYTTRLRGTSAFTGDATGTQLAGLVVGAIQGKTVPATGGSTGQVLELNASGNFVYGSRLSETSVFAGDVAGTQATGLTVDGIAGQGVETTAWVNGQVLGYNGTALTNVTLPVPPTSQVVSANVTAVNNRTYLCDARTAAFTITCPANPSVGDRFVVTDIFGLSSTNNITITSTDLIEGNADSFISSAFLSAEFIFADEWKVFVQSSRPTP